ncbi:multidrug resistance-associated protein 1-like isoform X1 [Centruroides sculpturatus]|uniref:multidrug resistance-associated protein 1-like isoform X1 n=1 Tax=Centruroides sculpturatus TaxID=218467 RepID=UPI000C6DAD14|nr:multidrug resistance-associated protein 1-like isoform X1 [Centruroides sculpturatus]
MELEGGFTNFCGSRFWTEEVWNGETLVLPICFRNIAFVWIPCGFLWLFMPLEIYFIYRSSEKAIPWTILNISRMVLALLLIAVSIIDLINDLHTSPNLPPVYIVSNIISICTLALFIILAICGQRKGIYSSGIIFIFLLLMTIGNFGFYYSHLSNLFLEVDIHVNTVNYIIAMIRFPLILAEFLFYCFADKIQIEEKLDMQKECPIKYASFLSKLLFWWFTNLAVLGWKRPLKQSDLWLLRPEDETLSILPTFNYYWKKQICDSDNSRMKTSNKKIEINIVSILIKTFGLYFLGGSSLKLIYDILQFVNPQILGLLINFTAGDEPLWKGIAYVLAMFVTIFLQSIVLGVYFNDMFVTGLRVRTVLISAIYRKSLQLSSSARSESTVGEIVNLMSVDSQRFMDLMTYLNLLWSAPLQIILAVYFLWNLLGPSVLAGIAVMILMLPLNGIIANKIKELQVQQMKNKDNRVKLMNEILNGMKVLKLYAWEEPFRKIILKIRDKEIDQLKIIAYLNLASTFCWLSAPIMVALATFATYVLIDEKNILDANKAFVSISLFNLLRFPMTMLPNLITTLVLVNVSIKRINKFLSQEELNQYVTSDSSYSDSIVIKNGTFCWSEKEDPVLKHIDISIPPGKLIAVVGRVGAGKSSLVSALLGDMHLITGKVNIKGKLAYVAQQAWIQNATVRQNIIFTSHFSKKKYDNIIEACALLPDFDILPGGDMTEIGEKGINLSGGQKQRVSLARAIYNNADVYLLDDPLSAVDSHVGKHIFDRVIGPNGLLRKKTRILVSHGITFLPQTDIIIVLKNGEIAEIGSYYDLLKSEGEFSEFILEYMKEKVADNDPLISDIMYQQDDPCTMKIELMRALSHSENQLDIKDKKHFSQSINDAEVVQSIKDKIKEERKLITVEFAETGKVKFSVYERYFKPMGIVIIVISVVGTLSSQMFSVGSNMWLSVWSNDKPNDDGSQDLAQRNFRLGIYAVLGFGQSIMSLIGYFGLAYGSIKSSFRLHQNILFNILRSPMAFFDTTPLGRIINRFAKDIDTIDTTIPMTLRSWIQCFTKVLGTIFIISYEIPVFLAVIVPLSIFYYLVQRFYIPTSRQLKRLESITRSPIYSHFSETLTGVSTIRAFRAEDYFISKCYKNVDINQCCYYPSTIANRWLAINLEFCGNCVVLFAGLFAVLAKDTLTAGSVGLIVSYALPVTSTLSWLVRMSSELETNIVAVERVIEYSETPTEAAWEKPESKPDPSWPQKGKVEFCDFSLQYRPELELVLKAIDCCFHPNEKIGIVGRTGAGKSSLTLSLFRIIESAGGRILIDDLDISKMGLHDLRSRLTIIPQDPVLFSGNLRMNLDPFDFYSDNEVWEALERSHLKNFVSSLKTGLQHEILEGGENLSVGQRQLVCLARALLRKTKILILDEATAAVDLETDDLIQATIRQEFSHCTIITIAHRLNTVIDYDRILVLENGCVAEFDSPSDLLQNKSSVFYSMAKDAGIV